VAIGAERYGSRVDTTAFVVCLVALALPAALRAPVAAALRRTVLLPVVAVESEAAAAREQQQSLTALRAERDSLALAAARLPAIEAENTQLRALLQLRGRLRVGFVTAEVLHQTGLADGLTLLLSAGRDAGIGPLSAVVAPSGLVGMVVAADPRTSVAMAWTHPDFRASVMIEGDGVYGIVVARRGASGGEVMELSGVPYRDTLAPGTQVVTSGLGGVFPRGIPVGTVVGLLGEAAGWERAYLLKPAAPPAAVTHVLVLSRAAAADTLTAAFDTASAPATNDSAARPGPPRGLKRGAP
jgi:rod shape-determining protein MreC